MRSLILTGMMGSGKTTCGKLLAAALNREFYDTDAMIVAQTGRAIAEIFETDGEAFFRDLETQLCRDLAGRSALVVATGGGLVLRRENVALLRQNGVILFLNRPAAQIFDATSMAGRPLAQNGKEAFLLRFSQREPHYRAAADLEITDFSDPHATVQSILEQLHKQEGVL